MCVCVCVCACVCSTNTQISGACVRPVCVLGYGCTAVLFIASGCIRVQNLSSVWRKLPLLAHELKWYCVFFFLL